MQSKSPLLKIARATTGATIDARKIERELGWKPTYSFETGIEKTVQWYLNHPQWVANVTSGEYRKWVDKQYG